MPLPAPPFPPTSTLILQRARRLLERGTEPRAGFSTHRGRTTEGDGYKRRCQFLREASRYCRPRSRIFSVTDGSFATRSKSTSRLRVAPAANSSRIILRRPSNEFFRPSVPIEAMSLADGLFFLV